MWTAAHLARGCVGSHLRNHACLRRTASYSHSHCSTLEVIALGSTIPRMKACPSRSKICSSGVVIHIVLFLVWFETWHEVIHPQARSMVCRGWTWQRSCVCKPKIRKDWFASQSPRAVDDLMLCMLKSAYTSSLVGPDHGQAQVRKTTSKKLVWANCCFGRDIHGKEITSHFWGSKKKTFSWTQQISSVQFLAKSGRFPGLKSMKWMARWCRQRWRCKPQATNH